MRRSVVLLGLIRHPAVMAWVLLLTVLFVGYCLVLAIGPYLRPPALQPAAFLSPLPDYVPREALVRLRSLEPQAVDAAVRQSGALRAERIRGTDFYRLTLPQSRTVSDGLNALRGAPNVEWAEPNFRVRTARVPDGPRFEELWGMRNVGRSFTSRNCGAIVGRPGADIAAERAWNLHRGDRKVLLAIMDTGIDYTHPNLKDNIWTNPGEIPGNGIDDDGNGYVDDVHGYDFANRDGDPRDDHGHGTHVAGTIGATGLDGSGVVGVNWEIRLMALKFLDEQGWGNIATAVEALAYARSFGVRITNNSWGGGGFSRALLEEIQKSRALFVTAAGNNLVDNDMSPIYPAGYDLPNVVSVAASDPRDNLGCFSNWGQTTVDVAAPGVAVLSTLPTYPCTLTEMGLEQGYDYLDGTSMATPHVAGALGLLLARHPAETEPQRKHRLVATASAREGLDGRCVANGRIDLHSALAARMVPPIAEAGPDIAAPPGFPVELDASASQPYPGRNLASHVWSKDGKVLRRSRNPRFTYNTSSERGIHRIDLEVFDNEWQSGRDSVRIEVADHVMTGAEFAFERKDRQTLRIRLAVRDAATEKPIVQAVVAVQLAAPGPLLFLGEGETDREGVFRGELRMPGGLPRGRYEARLRSLSHPEYVWDRKRMSQDWVNN